MQPVFRVGPVAERIHPTLGVRQHAVVTLGGHALREVDQLGVWTEEAEIALPVPAVEVVAPRSHGFHTGGHDAPSRERVAGSVRATLEGRKGCRDGHPARLGEVRCRVVQRAERRKVGRRLGCYRSADTDDRARRAGARIRPIGRAVAIARPGPDGPGAGIGARRTGHDTARQAGRITKAEAVRRDGSPARIKSESERGRGEDGVTFGLTDQFHTGFVVRDLDATIEGLRDVLRLRWTAVQNVEVDAWDIHGPVRGRRSAGVFGSRSRTSN